MHRPCCASPKSRNIGEIEGLSSSARRCINDEDVSALRRCARVVFGWRGGRSGGTRREGTGGGANVGVLVESEKFSIGDNGYLGRIEQAQLCGNESKAYKSLNSGQHVPKHVHPFPVKSGSLEIPMQRSEYAVLG